MHASYTYIVQAVHLALGVQDMDQSHPCIMNPPFPDLTVPTLTMSVDLLAVFILD